MVGLTMLRHVPVVSARSAYLLCSPKKIPIPFSISVQLSESARSGLPSWVSGRFCEFCSSMDSDSSALCNGGFHREMS